jgi:hypothetical protein
MRDEREVSFLFAFKKELLQLAEALPREISLKLA